MPSNSPAARSSDHTIALAASFSAITDRDSSMPDISASSSTTSCEQNNQVQDQGLTASEDDSTTPGTVPCPFLRIARSTDARINTTVPDSSGNDKRDLMSRNTVEDLLEELNHPTTLFLGNPKLLDDLMEWFEDGRTSHLILKRADKAASPQQAEIHWIGSISHDRFRLSLDGGWRIYPGDPQPTPFTKAKASCYVTALTVASFRDSWTAALQNAKEMIKSKKRYGIKNSLLNEDGSEIKIRHACFEVMSHTITHLLSLTTINRKRRFPS